MKTKTKQTKSDKLKQREELIEKTIKWIFENNCIDVFNTFM